MDHSSCPRLAAVPTGRNLSTAHRRPRIQKHVPAAADRNSATAGAPVTPTRSSCMLRRRLAARPRGSWPPPIGFDSKNSSLKLNFARQNKENTGANKRRPTSLADPCVVFYISVSGHARPAGGGNEIGCKSRSLVAAGSLTHSIYLFGSVWPVAKVARSRRAAWRATRCSAIL